MKYIYLLLLLVSHCLLAQPDVDAELHNLQAQLEKVRLEEQKLMEKIEKAKLKIIRRDLAKSGLPRLLPGERLVEHEAYDLVYSEEHEQAKWVAHIISPDVAEGNLGRSNDFRPDPKIETGSAVQEDYFLTDTLADGNVEYDGFGYDRGHLAPSADFRWSSLAVSESYYYSNMSPQLAEVNRGEWAKMEAMLRAYVIRNGAPLYVVTGPVLKPGLPRIERGINKVSVPELFFKVAVDLENKRGVAFLMMNEENTVSLEKCLRTIDEVEAITGLDFYAALPDGLEAELEGASDPTAWLPSNTIDVAPADIATLPRGCFNSEQARLHMGSGKRVKVCGTIVSGKLTNSGNVFLNMDKRYPNQIFSVFIPQDMLINFGYEPHIELEGAQVCVQGEVSDFKGVPTIMVSSEKAIEHYKPKSQ